MQAASESSDLTDWDTEDEEVLEKEGVTEEEEEEEEGVLVQSRRMSLRGETGPFTESHPQ
jgi:hypothetical protein